MRRASPSRPCTPNPDPRVQCRRAPFGAPGGWRYRDDGDDTHEVWPADACDTGTARLRRQRRRHHHRRQRQLDRQHHRRRDQRPHDHRHADQRSADHRRPADHRQQRHRHQQPGHQRDRHRDRRSDDDRHQRSRRHRHHRRRSQRRQQQRQHHRPELRPLRRAQPAVHRQRVRHQLSGSGPRPLRPGAGVRRDQRRMQGPRRPLRAGRSPSVACGASTCGPGSVCDDVDTCLPISPCADVVCTSEGDCWGAQCVCERAKDCMDPTLEAAQWRLQRRDRRHGLRRRLQRLDGHPAQRPRLSAPPQARRRAHPVDRRRQPQHGRGQGPAQPDDPAAHVPFPLVDKPQAPDPVEGLGEVAITYTCCPTCGCQADPPQAPPASSRRTWSKPLPIVIIAQKTQGTGPFASTAADAGPQGLTWGVDRVLYVG
jgi:hypothetical protein